MPASPTRMLTPWYDSRGICLVGLLLMTAVFLFAIIGLSVAYEAPEYKRHLFIPAILAGLSLCGIGRFAMRLARQSMSRNRR